MANLTVSFNIPEVKVDEYVAHYVYVHKNVEVDENGDPIYTDAQWVREHILRYVRSQIVRGKKAKDRDTLEKYIVDDVE